MSKSKDRGRAAVNGYVMNTFGWLYIKNLKTIKLTFVNQGLVFILYSCLDRANKTINFTNF